MFGKKLKDIISDDHRQCVMYFGLNFVRFSYKQNMFDSLKLVINYMKGIPLGCLEAEYATYTLCDHILS